MLGSDVVIALNGVAISKCNFVEMVPLSGENRFFSNALFPQ